jgi:cytochrome P450
MSLKKSVQTWVSSTPVLRAAFGVLRTVRPVAVIGKNVFVTRYKDVADVLTRESEFTVYEIDGYKMEALGNPFVLGMDASPIATRDRNILRQVIKREDLETIVRPLIISTANKLLEESIPKKSINVVNEYARVAAVRLVAVYFGVPADEKKMMGWQRAVFNDAFVNLSNDPEIHKRAEVAAKELKEHMINLIAERKQQSNLEDNVLNRLILKQAENDWLDDLTLRQIISGCVLGVVENISKVVTHVIDQLLNRPEEFKKVTEAARKGDMVTVRKYTFEALRFNPHNPAILRFCRNGAVIGKGTKHERKIPAGSTVYAATLGGMFDPEVVKKPKSFDPERNVDYMHFGHGPHACAGRYISEIAAPELVAGLLRLKNLRRAPGKAGRIVYDEVVFPDRLILEYLI